MRATESYLLAWTTYGTWQYDGRTMPTAAGAPAFRPAGRAAVAEPRMVTPVVLDPAQRGIVEEAIRTRCRLRRWALHAVKVRGSHVLVVVTADSQAAEVMNDLKAWCARRLTDPRPGTGGLVGPHGLLGEPRRWWGEYGEITEILDQEYLDHAIRYVNQG